jgi:Holliday junction resolvase
VINSRDKGKRGELELAALLRSHGWSAHRGQQFAGGPDSPDVVSLPGVHIECKRVERLNIDTAIEQSKRDADPAEAAVVMHRRNRKPWLVTMTFEDWLRMYDFAQGTGRS